MSRSEDVQPVGQSRLAAVRRKMQWTISLALWASYCLLVAAVIASGALSAWVHAAEWKEGPPLFFFILMPTALVLLTFEVWIGPLRRRR